MLVTPGTSIRLWGFFGESMQVGEEVKVSPWNIVISPEKQEVHSDSYTINAIYIPRGIIRYVSPPTRVPLVLFSSIQHP